MRGLVVGRKFGAASRARISFEWRDPENDEDHAAGRYLQPV